MSFGSLEGAVAKMYRAAEHYRVLKDLNDGVDFRTYPVRMDRDDEGLTYRFYIGELKPIHPDSSLIMGDGFHNLRSALDHLVLQLYVRRFKGKVPDDVVRTSAFPILGNRRLDSRKNDLPTDKWRDIGRLSKKQRTTIEWMQPYHRWSPKDKGRKPKVWQYRHTLDEVSWFDNVDKHQTLHVVQSMPRSIHRPDFPDEFGFRGYVAFGVPLESGAHVDTWTFRVAPPAEHMQAHRGVIVGPTVEKSPGDRIATIQSLGGSIHGVGQILELFAPLFPAPSRPFQIPWVRLKLS
jgi:hypothetical protein